MYTSLAGQQVKIMEDEKTFIYPKTLLEPLFTDPISKEWLRDPVVLNGNLYDRDSISKWLRISNIDPLTGEDIIGSVRFFPFNIIKFIMYSLEEREEELVFHSPLNSILFAHFYGTVLPFESYTRVNDWTIHTETKRKMFKYSNVQQFAPELSTSITSFFKEFECELDSIEFKNESFCNVYFKKLDNVSFLNCSFTNCFPIEEIKKKSCPNCTFESDLAHFSLEDYLFTDIFTGKQIDFDNIKISESGYIFKPDLMLEHLDAVKTKKEGKCSSPFCRPHPKERFIDKNFTNKENTSAKVILGGFKDVLDTVQQRFIEPVSWDSYNGSIAFKEPVVDTIEVRSQAERVYEKVQSILSNLDESTKKGFLKLSSMVNTESIKEADAPAYFNSNLMKMRKILSLPFLVDQESNTYGQDFSFLTLSGKTITNCAMKDFIFAGADLQNTIFVKCSFMECCFVSCDLRGTTFVDCEFNYEREFYKTLSNSNTNFIRCTCSNKQVFDRLHNSN